MCDFADENNEKSRKMDENRRHLQTHFLALNDKYNKKQERSSHYYYDENYGWVFYDEEMEKQMDEYYEYCENEYEEWTAEKEAMEGIDDDLPNSFFEEVFGWKGGEPLIAPADTEKETINI